MDISTEWCHKSDILFLQDCQRKLHYNIVLFYSIPKKTFKCQFDNLSITKVESMYYKDKIWYDAKKQAWIKKAKKI